MRQNEKGNTSNISRYKDRIFQHCWKTNHWIQEFQLNPRINKKKPLSLTDYSEIAVYKDKDNFKSKNSSVKEKWRTTFWLPTVTTSHGNQWDKEQYLQWTGTKMTVSVEFGLVIFQEWERKRCSEKQRPMGGLRWKKEQWARMSGNYVGCG